MAKLSVRGSAGSGTTRSRSSFAAAARAAAKRAEKAHGSAAEEPAGEPRRRGLIDALKADTSADKAAAEPKPKAKSGSEEATAEPKRRRSGLLGAGLALLVVAGLAATTVLGLDYRDAESAGEARTEALAAAQKAAPAILSYDYRHLDKDFAAARSHITGDFEDKYRKTTTTVVAPTAKRYHGVVKATVAKPASGDPAASVVSASPDKVVVLLFMNQVTNSTQVSGSRVDLNRVRMTLQRTSDGWKVSAVDAL
ncbi:hypothetical protein FCH28_06955 [Streptomyces piniterrae]|uniref:Mce-associated membrane protein n=1 Tax=Streptomyces piniterrae TaxID=2571125 RepID=A0A4V5MLH2_9ACTN|nr:hypothetical protein [Streptomyces piniterrae]TJZ57178.1 hypothetical protein FCH28_06955 [Streptomyces piniterrae]